MLISHYTKRRKGGKNIISREIKKNGRLNRQHNRKQYKQRKRNA